MMKTKLIMLVFAGVLFINPGWSLAQRALSSDLSFFVEECIRSYDEEENLFSGGEDDWDECQYDQKTWYVINVIRDMRNLMDGWGGDYRHYVNDLLRCESSC